MATDNPFDKQKLIEALRAQGVTDKEIEKLVGGPVAAKVPPNNNAKKNAEYKKKNAWKYQNKHNMPVRQEDEDPDYEPIEELRNGQNKKNVKKPRIGKKKPKPRPKRFDWTATTEERLRNLYEAGYSINDIAKELGTTVDAITSKITRLKAAGWKAQVGTTHNPLPDPNKVRPDKRQGAQKDKFGDKLGPESRRILYSLLEKNFGAAGRYFGRKWGLAPDKMGKGGTVGGKGGGDPEVVSAVIKGNQATMTALTKLDTALKRSTNMLTKRIAKATDGVTDAINKTTDLAAKMQNNVVGGPQQGILGSSGSKLATGVLGAMLGAGILSMMMGDKANASITYNDDLPDTDMQDDKPDKPDLEDVEIKSRELSFEADDILFEADKFKFNGGVMGGAVIGGARPEGGGIKKPYTGFFNELADKMFGTGGGDGQGGYGDKSGGGGGESGGGGGRTGGGGGGDAEPAKKGNPTFADRWNDRIDTPMASSQTLAEQRKKFFDEYDNDPALQEKIKRIAANEQGSNPMGVQKILESLWNRARVRGTSLAQEARWHESEGGYYQQGNMGNGIVGTKKFEEAYRKGLEAVRGGSNAANYATDNASGGLAAREAADGTFIKRSEENGETFFAPGTAEPKHNKNWLKWKEDTEKAEAARKQQQERLYIPRNDATPSTGGGADRNTKEMENDTADWMNRKGARPEPAQQPTSGQSLNTLQKEQDDAESKKWEMEDRWKGDGGKDRRSDSTDPVNNDSFHTTLLETEGPNHFSDYPGFENGTNSYGVV